MVCFHCSDSSSWNHSLLIDQFHRGTIEVVNPNADPNVESGGGPFARGRAPESAMGVWRTPKNDEYATPEALVGRKVRVYFDGDCTYFEAQVLYTVVDMPGCVFCYFRVGIPAGSTITRSSDMIFSFAVPSWGGVSMTVAVHCGSICM